MAELADPWTLRCFAKIAGYARRLDSGEFRVDKRVDRKPVSHRSRCPVGSHHCTYKAYDKVTDDLVYFAFVPTDAAGNHWPRWKLDPKVLLYNGIRYQKDEEWVSPAERISRFTVQKRVFGWFYARWRNFLCWLRGR